MKYRIIESETGFHPQVRELFVWRVIFKLGIHYYTSRAKAYVHTYAGFKSYSKAVDAINSYSEWLERSQFENLRWKGEK